MANKNKPRGHKRLSMLLYAIALLTLTMFVINVTRIAAMPVDARVCICYPGG